MTTPKRRAYGLPAYRPRAHRSLAHTMLGVALLVVACAPADPSQASSTETGRAAPPEAVQSRAPVVFPDTWQYSADAPPAKAENAMVVTTDRYASEIGAAIMEQGGNAVDAAVAVSLALAVVNPEAGNLGGGGFMVVRMADGTTAALDYREKAPMAATRDMFLDEEGEAVRSRSRTGHLASGVPGSVAGLLHALDAYGTKPRADLLDPAIRLAAGKSSGEEARDANNRG